VENPLSVTALASGHASVTLEQTLGALEFFFSSGLLGNEAASARDVEYLGRLCASIRSAPHHPGAWRLLVLLCKMIEHSPSRSSFTATDRTRGQLSAQAVTFSWWLKDQNGATPVIHWTVNLSAADIRATWGGGFREPSAYNLPEDFWERVGLASYIE